MSIIDQRILILCKTYPSPSGKYVETSCVAGLTEHGQLIRLFPVPFRLVNDEQKFKKWQWIEAKVERARDDRRPESHKIKMDTVRCSGDPVPTTDNWRARRSLLDRQTILESFHEMEGQRQTSGTTLALLRPKKLVCLEISEVKNAEWTAEETEKLAQHEAQLGLFGEKTTDLKTLKKLPYDFHYRYVCDGPEGADIEVRHKLADWEAGALYWNCRARYGEAWESPFRDRLERHMSERDLIFLMGTIHRFPNQWLIVSLIYPPKSAGPVQQVLI